MLYDYLEADGVEVINTARLQAYLTNVGSPFDTGPAICRCDSLTAEILGAPAPYDTPATDPAPWYDVDYDHSGEYLGFLPLSITGLDNNPRAREISGVVGGGGTFGPVRDLPRTITVTGVLIGSSCCGAEYGLHYLTEALQSCAGTSCQGGCVSMYLCCPDPGMTKIEFDAKYRRTFLGSSLVSGPEVVRRTAGNGGTCTTGACSGGEMIEVEFVIVASNPWAWTDLRPALDVALPEPGTGDCIEWCTDSVDGVCDGEPCLFQDCSETATCVDPLLTVVIPPQPTAPATDFCVALSSEWVCYDVDLSTRPRWSEDYPVITVSSGNVELRNVRIAIYERGDPTTTTCDQNRDDQLCSPVNDFVIRYMPAGSEMTLDGRTGRASIDCGNGCQPATSAFGDDDGSPFTVAPLDCARYCVCVSTDNALPAPGFPTAGTNLSVSFSGKGL